MKRVLRFIPKNLRHSLYRNSAVQDFETSKNLTFKLAETLDELEQAFRLIYVSRRQKGQVEADSSGVSIEKFHAMPTTKLLIALEEKKVMAVLCLNLDTPFRSPCEEYFDIGELKTKGRSFFEISSFAVASGAEDDSKSFLFPFLKMSLELNRNYFKTESLVTTVDSKEFDYWSSLLFLRSLSEKNVKRPDSRQQLLVCAYAPISDLENKFKEKYGKRKSKNNFYQYLFVKTDPRIEMPISAEIFERRYSPTILNFLFNEKTTIFSHLTSFETRAIHKIYSDAQYAPILPGEISKARFENNRHAKRYHADLSGTLRRENSKPIDISVKTVSIRGLGAICTEKLDVEKTYFMKVSLGGGLQVDLLVSPVWASPGGRASDHTYGFVIRSQNEQWIKFVESFYLQEKKAS